MVASFPVTRRSGWRPLAAATTAVVLLSVSGCGVFSDSPTPAADQSFDLCERIDLSPLDDLSPTLWEEKSSPSVLGGRCVLSMRTADGHRIILEATAHPRSYVSNAEKDYRDTADIIGDREREGTQMSPLGPVEDIGDEAEAHALQMTPEPGVFTSEYALIARAGTLVVLVDLRLVGDDEHPPYGVGAMARSIATGIIATAPPKPAPSPPPDRVGMRYDVSGIDLCEELDLSLLDDLPLALEETSGSIWRETNSECTFEFDDGFSSLRVLAQAHLEFWFAEGHYVDALDKWHDPTDPDSYHSIPDLGERALATVEPKGIWHYRTLNVLIGNLFLHLKLTLHGEEETFDPLAELMRPVAEDALALIPIVRRP